MCTNLSSTTGYKSIFSFYFKIQKSPFLFFIDLTSESAILLKHVNLCFFAGGLFSISIILYTFAKKHEFRIGYETIQLHISWCRTV